LPFEDKKWEEKLDQFAKSELNINKISSNQYKIFLQASRAEILSDKINIAIEHLI